MYESWTNKDSDIDIEGYISHNFFRKFQNRNAKRHSGGIVLYYKETIQQGISVVRTHIDTIIWIKLDHIFFNTDSDIYICGVYLWGEDSPAYNITNVDLFEIIQSDIYDFECLGSVYVVGDLNSRIGSRHDYISFDNYVPCMDFDGYVPDSNMPERISQDKVSNNFGIKLLDLCKSTGMRVCNSRIGNDFNVGMYTYATSQGASVIDYLLANEINFPLIHNFTVHSFNEYSDHAPLSFSFCCSRINDQSRNIKHDSTKYMWNCENKDTFRAEIISNLPVFNRIVQSIDVSCRQSINTALDDFTSRMREIADPLFAKTYIQASHRNEYCFSDKPLVKHAVWFDDDCLKAKQLYLESMYKFNRYKNDCTRKQFCSNKVKYKNLCKLKKKQHELVKISEIEHLKSAKPKDFWKFFYQEIFI